MLPNSGTYISHQLQMPQSHKVTEPQLKPLAAGSKELVYISHFVSPHKFYVQREPNQAILKHLIKEFKQAVMQPKLHLSQISEGKLYLAYMEVHQAWHRCKILNIDMVECNKAEYEVYCVDYGITTTVSLDRLRSLPKEWQTTPNPLALTCMLANCEPLAGKWETQDVQLMQDIIENNIAAIYVRRVRPNGGDVVYECDVVAFETNENMLHALVFNLRARLIDPNLPDAQFSFLEEKPQLLISNTDFTPDSVHDVLVTYVRSPNKFYVRKSHWQKAFERLCQDIEHTYELCFKRGAIHCPTKGLLCVAYVEEIGWRRCVVREIEGERRVRVWLPDCGNTLVVPSDALRRIEHNFTTQKALAVECHLYGVTCVGRTWSPESVALLDSCRDLAMKATVEPERNNSASVGVTLHHYNRSITSEMIRLNLGIPFGLYALNETTMAEANVITKELSRYNISKLTQSINNLDIDTFQVNNIVGIKLEVELLSCTSPSIMFVTLKHLKHVYRHLYGFLQKYYYKSRDHGGRSWKTSDRCCALFNKSKEWRRAVIMETICDKIKVFYVDFATIDMVSVNRIREIPSELSKIPFAAIKCQLSGIIPAGGNKWASICKEYLTDLIQTYDRYFVIQTNRIELKSYPVTLWVYHESENVKEWRCLNDRLVDQGVALPVRSTKLHHSDILEDGESILDIAASATQWLCQLSKVTIPIKSKKIESTDTPSKVAKEVKPVDMNASPTSPPSIISYNTVTPKWLPAKPLSVKEFTGEPVYIDQSGVIFVHNVNQTEDRSAIRSKLDQLNMVQEIVAQQHWSVGDSCYAKYTDHLFYRGRILKINPHKCSYLVHYVDFGDEQFCTVSDIRRPDDLFSIPVQAYKCALAGIKVKQGRWTDELLKFLKEVLVGNESFIKVQGISTGDVLPIQVKCSGLWLHEHLLECHEDVYLDSSVDYI